jgi:5S rRNA maturation endonuclease (ribonuclease M5)
MSERSARRNPARIRNPRIDYYAWKMEQTEKILNNLRSLSESGIPIIVEGRKDEAALRKLGVQGRILPLKAHGESRHDFLERLDGTKSAVILTDFDREGKKLETWLYKELLQRGVKSDLKLWSRIKSLARAEVRSVEELPDFMRTLQARTLGMRSASPTIPRKKN